MQSLSSIAGPTRESPPRAPLLFFVLVVALSVPLWVLGAMSGTQLLPGVPISALMAFCPAAAAMALSAKEDPKAATRLVVRSLEWTRLGWRTSLLPAFLLMPLIAGLSYVLMRAAGLLLPTFSSSWTLPPALFAVFLIGGLAEEIGWSAYMLERLQRQLGALAAALVIGVLWALWHVVPFLQAGRPPGWTAWQNVNQIATRVLLVWLYYSSDRSVLAVSICHAMSNVTWQLFPNQGSHYAPRVFAGVTVSVAVLVVSG